MTGRMDKHRHWKYTAGGKRHSHIAQKIVFTTMRKITEPPAAILNDMKKEMLYKKS
jgi:hypothetical protein